MATIGIDTNSLGTIYCTVKFDYAINKVIIVNTYNIMTFISVEKVNTEQSNEGGQAGICENQRIVYRLPKYLYFIKL